MWRWRPDVALLLALALVVYAIGWARLARRSPARRRGAPVARLALSLAGLVGVAIALLGLHDAAHERFAAHMAQHLLLMMIAVPLLLLADPLPAALWALPAAARRHAGAWLADGAAPRRAWRAVTRLPVAWILYALVLWLWHLPAAYDAALRIGWLHDLEHLSFTAAAVVFWWPVIAPAPRVAAPSSPVARVVYLVLAAFSGGVLGVLLAASPAPLYAYATADPLADQARGGVLMWAVGGAIDMLAVLVCVSRTMGGAAGPGVPPGARAPRHRGPAVVSPPPNSSISHETGPWYASCSVNELVNGAFLDRSGPVGENVPTRRMAAEPLVRVRDLVRVFGATRVLDGVDLDVAAGEAVALLGSNGAGKTTLLKIVATLLRPSRGTATVAGHDCAREAEAVRPLIGVVAHGVQLYEDLTARENLKFWATLSGLPTDADTLAQALADVDLERHASVRVRTFSAGMKRRLALARVGLARPRVLLLDEPFAALDARARKWLEGRLESFKADGGALIMATHSFGRELGTADRLAILAGGRIALDTPRGVLGPDDVQRLYVAHTEETS